MVKEWQKRPLEDIYAVVLWMAEKTCSERTVERMKAQNSSSLSLTD